MTAPLQPALLQQREDQELGAALRHVVEYEWPYKRWGFFLSGGWEEGWSAEAWSRIAGGGRSDLYVRGDTHFPTPLAALDALSAELERRREAGQ